STRPRPPRRERRACASPQRIEASGAGVSAGPVVTALRMRKSLRRDLADPRRPVGERTAPARAVARATARAEQVVAGAEEERAAPVGVVAAVSDVLARDPDGVAVHRGRAVVAPARALRVREVL